MTAAGRFYPEVFQFIERAPVVLVPVALIYLVHHHRLDHVPTKLTTQTLTLPEPEVDPR